MLDRGPKTVDITTSTFLKFFGLVLLVVALWSVRNVVVLAAFAIILASAMMPAVDALQRRRVPRSLSIALLYILVLGVVTVILVLFGQLVADQVRELATNVPGYYDRAIHFFFRDQVNDQALAQGIQKVLQSLNDSLARLSSQVAAGTITAVSGIFSFIGVLIFTFYILMEKDGFRRFVASVAPDHFVPYLNQLQERIQTRLGGWVRGQLLLSLIIAAVSYLGLLLLGVDFALSLALIAGLSELIPIAGPIIGAVPAILVAFGQSPLLAGLVALLYLVIQQLENNLIVPKVMQRLTGLNPIVTIIVVLIGAKLAGFAGVLLAIPLTLIADTFLEDFFKESDESSA